MEVFLPCLILQARKKKKNEMSIPVEANCNQIDSERCDQHFSKGRWSHHINDFVVEEIILYLAKVC